MSDRTKRRRPARIIDIAQAAGVGTATVDRVLNGRDGVATATAARVRSAMEMLSARVMPGRDSADRTFLYAFDVILPANAGPSTVFLGDALREAGRQANAAVVCAFVEKMNPAALAEKLTDCVDRGTGGIMFQALDHPLVREAVSRAAAKDVPMLALLSDLAGSEAFGYVGADNRAAGRTAGLLMGRFTRQPGKVAVLWGGQMYRSHEEREIGFRTLIRTEFPHLKMLDLVSGGDDPDGNYREICSVLDEHDDLVGIYSVGGGNRGVVQALADRGKSRSVVTIGHNLTATTHRFLVEGSMDAVIHQDLELAAGRAIAAMIHHGNGQTPGSERLPVEVIIRENIPNRFLEHET